MSTCPRDEVLAQLLADALPPEEQSAVKGHAAACDRCRQMLQQLSDATTGRTTPEGTQAWVPTLDPGEDWRTYLSPSDEPGSLGRLGGCEVLGLIGRGGMGVVLKGYDPLLLRPVAVKVLAPHLAADETSLRRFLREAQVAAAIEHDNVVGIHAVSPGPPPFLVMPFIAGENLQQRLERGRPTVLEVVRVGRQIAAGLAAAHAKGLIHRDVKPANVLLEAGHPDDDPHVKITDFGLARAVDDAGISHPGTIAGTPKYMSPEQARDERIDHRSDLFSLGSLLYAMLAGRPPFAANSSLAVMKRVCEATPRPIRESNPDAPAWLIAVVARLLEKNPAHRYQTAAEVADALERGIAPPPRRRLWPWAVAVSVVAAVAVAIYQIPPTYQPPVRQHPPGPSPPAHVNALEMEFVLVPRGRFWAGGTAGTEGTREVEIGYDFYLGKYELTQAQWRAVKRQDVSHFSRKGGGKERVADVEDADLDRFPADSLSHYQVITFLQRLNSQAAEPGWEYCLPTPDEWEYACRGGPMADPSASAADFYLESGPAIRLAAGEANFNHKGSPGRTCPVGSYRPNRLGLHDMHGNVFELCEGESWLRERVAAPLIRGGAWDSDPSGCRAGLQQQLPYHYTNSGIGLRLARVHVGTKGR